MSSQAQHDIKVPKVKLGYIDHDFDLGSYPQELPRVLFDGEGLSSRGYVCLDTYRPVPGDRVVLLPQGTGYIIVGSINQRTSQTLDPGQMVLSINNHRPSGQQSFSNGVYLEWSAW